MSALSNVDRRIIAKADEVAALRTAAAQRARYGDADSDMARAAALGEAQFLLVEQNAIIKRLLAIIERPTGDSGGQDSSEEGERDG